jgi:hypothetical protein
VTAGPGAARAAAGESGGDVRCWCCGRFRPPEAAVHLGEHPEVAVCLDCAHFLHQRARSAEDAMRPSPAARARDGLRAVRRLVIAHRWHERSVIGGVLRWLGARLP